jgi:predicted dehydrogenase
MNESVIRWGILGTANIARKNWKSIRNSGNGMLRAVASRDPRRAAQFIRDCQYWAPFEQEPIACGSYQELLDRSDVDAVYIPLPTGIRRDWVLRAADAGKHIICEKPCGSDAAEVREMLRACERNRVQFMDGVMFMHGARLEKLRQVLDDATSVGPIRRISSQFSFLAPEAFRQENIRVSSQLEPLGCLGDLGWYNIRFSLWAMNFASPQAVAGRILAEHGRDDSESAVPVEFSGELFFEGGATAAFYCSFVTEHQQWAHISGTRGFINVPDFVLPYFGGEAAFELNQPAFEVHGCDFNMVSHPRRFAVPEYSSGYPHAQESNLFRKFGQIVASRKLEPHWGAVALQTQQVLDACLHSARQDGVKTPFAVIE